MSSTSVSPPAHCQLEPKQPGVVSYWESPPDLLGTCPLSKKQPQKDGPIWSREHTGGQRARAPGTRVPSSLGYAAAWLLLCYLLTTHSLFQRLLYAIGEMQN